MPLSAWINATLPLADWLGDYDMAVDTAFMIADKPTSITVTRIAAGVTTVLAAQTVRIEEFRGNRQVTTSAGQVYQVDAVILGYKGHATIVNTNLQPGDRFAIAGVRYEVIVLVVALTDSLQAYCRVLA